MQVSRTNAAMRAEVERAVNKAARKAQPGSPARRTRAPRTTLAAEPSAWDEQQPARRARLPPGLPALKGASSAAALAPVSAVAVSVSGEEMKRSRA